VADCLAILFYLRWTNIRRDKKRTLETLPEHQEKFDSSPGSQLLDVPDLKNKKFRYVF
jgi:hypothetical protein